MPTITRGTCRRGVEKSSDDSKNEEIVRYRIHHKCGPRIEKRQTNYIVVTTLTSEPAEHGLSADRAEERDKNLCSPSSQGHTLPCRQKTGARPCA